MYDFGSLALQNLVPTQAQTASTNVASVIKNPYIGTMALVLDSAAGTGTAPTLNAVLQDSPDNITFTNVAGGAFAPVTGAGVSQQRLNLDSNVLNKFLRVATVIAGTTPSFTFSVNMLGRKQVLP
jgi:hypothetical protein